MKHNFSIFDLIKRYRSIGSRIFILIRDIIMPFRIIEKYVPKKGKIIDVGCGHGALSLYLGLKGKKRKVSGYDLDRQRIKSARYAASGISNVKFAVKDLRKSTDLKDADAVLLIDLLHHIPYDSQKKVLKECFKRLKKGGKLIIKDMSDLPRWKYYFNYFHDMVISGDKKLFYLKPSLLKKELIKIGFKIEVSPFLINNFFLNPYSHFLIIASK